MMDDSYAGVYCLGGTRSRYRYAVAGRYIGQPSLVTQPQLCEKCNNNQALKIQELNSFEPLRECDFESELKPHKQKLDQKYQLCQSCQDIVNHHLKTQAIDLKTFLLDSHLQQSKSTPTKLLKRSSSPESIFLVLVQLVCVLLASLLVCSESRPDDHSMCGKNYSFWNSPHVLHSTFFSYLTSSNHNFTAKQIMLRFPGLVKSIMISLWSKGLELIFCLSSLTKRRYLHVSLACLLLNILIFLRRKTRFGILTLLSWTVLSVLRFWELFWWKSDCRWRFISATLCWFLSSSLFLFSLLSYSRVLEKHKKRRYRISPSKSSSDEYQSTECEIMEIDSEYTPPNNKIATELDYNLNGLSLDGLRTERRNGFHTHHSSPVNPVMTGSFWRQNLATNNEESPLVSMQQRPLIVPATLHFSGLPQKSSIYPQEAITVTRPGGSNPRADSSDDDTFSDSTEEEPCKNLKMWNNKRPSPVKNAKKIKRCSSRRKAGSLRRRFLSARTLLLLVSLLLNLYFLILFTEWPARILHSLLKISMRLY